ncbi:MAG: DedA family protein [Thermodesulfobacteriota bacterium]|jgi:membrane-associated protein|nr:MAG: DedA family protein [Thermodesulfobacteriota bacterium]
MELITYYIDIFLHLDRYLSSLIQQYGFWTHFILFFIIFCETGLVVTPFLPGDSLLFATGTFAARGSLELTIVLALLSVAAIAGDTINYWFGFLVGPKILERKKIRWVKKEYIDRTHQFYEKYGGKTIVLARFIPIIRTFAPFVAGIGTMAYSRFLLYNILGGVFWVLSLTLLGFFFGNIPIVKDNFSLVIVVIIVISILPAVIEAFRQRRQTH